MEILLLSLIAFLVSILTFFSGFGLGTILLPVFMIFFPVDLAVALTGVVHLFNNIFKLLLIGGKADRKVLISFGIPAVIFAVAGSYLLLGLSESKPVFTYVFAGRNLEIYSVKLILSVLLIFFALMDIIPHFRNTGFDRKNLPIGGALSGFFGGLTGMQGAFRSAFLIKAGLSKEAFIATAAVVSTFVDFTRLSVYATRFASSGVSEELPVVVAATLSAVAGAFIGNRMMKKVTYKYLRILVTVLLITVAIGLGMGIL